MANLDYENSKIQRSFTNIQMQIFEKLFMQGICKHWAID